MHCKRCNHPVLEGNMFCANCGLEIEGDAVEISATMQEESLTKERFSLIKYKGLLSIKFIIPVIAILAVITLILYNPFGENNSTIVTYTKDNELLSRNLEQDKSFILTNSVFEEKDQTELQFSGGQLSFQSKDGKYVYYFDEVTNDGTGSLYRKEISKINNKNMDDKGVKISSNINFQPSPRLTEAGSILYMKEYSVNEGGRLYINDLKEEIKIDSEVFSYDISPDDKMIYYIKDIKDGEGQLYSKILQGDAESTEIDSDVTQLLYVAQDGKKILYTKNDNKEEFTSIVYEYQTEKNEKNQLFRDARDIKKINEDWLVFIKAEKVKYGFADLFDDDMEQTDKSLTKPVPPEYTSFQKIENNYWGSYQTVDWDLFYDAQDEYYAKVDSYNLKAERDELRKYYTENPIEMDRYDLYEYINGAEQKVDDNVSIIGSYTFSNSTAMVYPKVDEVKLNKKKMSELTSFYSFDTWNFSEVLSSAETIYMLRTVSGKSTEIGSTSKIQDINANEDFSKLYFVDDFNLEENQGTLMEYILDNESIKEKNTIDEDVSILGYNEEKWPFTIYFKEVKNGIGEMYIKNGEKKAKVADDVYTYMLKSIDNGKNIYCLTDVSSNDYKGKLSLINDFKESTVSDDVSNFYLRNSSEILYLKDYDNEKHRGELWYQKEQKEPLKIDDDVTQLIAY